MSEGISNVGGMEPWIILLLTLNLVVTGVIAWFVLRPGSRDHAAQLITVVREDLSRQRSELQQSLSLAHERIEGRLQASSTSLSRDLATERESRANEYRQMRQDLRVELERMREGNEAKLEKMRETVDEKLQGTLEKRLGESFALVSERLEQVQKGLGEMQSLAQDVGGLKRVLTNVKNRGGWGEVQLARQLEDMLSPDQYEENVKIHPEMNERVEFAVRLPGRDSEARVVYLPIDSKFPQEDYERLLQAQEQGDKEEISRALQRVERVMIDQATLISSKYIVPPYSTDFAIMYLPTEGLFAEAIRLPGLASRLQREHRVVITGPSTLMMLLNSLQMGFRTLAIEQRSSEVWQVLGLAKTEFQKYGAVWEKLGKHLQTAQNTVEEAGRRTRAVERRLRDIESIDADEAGVPLDDLLGDMLESETSRTSTRED